VPPFNEASARAKVQAAEDAWNSRDPQRVAAVHTVDSQWRNRADFIQGRPAIVEFLTAKWERELDYALRKSLWAFTDDRIAVRFQYEWRDAAGQWWRSYGSENWQFDAAGYMSRRETSINDVPIDVTDRRILGPRPPEEHDPPLPLQVIPAIVPDKQTGPDPMHVTALWRYPVKSLGGEPLQTAQLTADGVAGDRTVHVRGGRGPLTGRTRHDLLTVAAGTGSDGAPRVAGHPWDSPAAGELVRQAAGPDAQLAAYDGPERFDITNLLVATDGAVARFGADVRRLRPNLLLAGVPDHSEPDWPDYALAIGDALIGVHSVRQRCVVTTIDPDTGEQDLDVFRRIRSEFGGELALNCWVIRPGTVAVGDPACLVGTDEQPADLGGWIVGAPYARSR